jgi:hypothetical protein
VSNLYQRVKKIASQQLYNLIAISKVTQRGPLKRYCTVANTQIGDGFDGMTRCCNYEPVILEVPQYHLPGALARKFGKNFRTDAQEYSSGILGFRNVCLSLPYSIVRWKGKVFLETLRNNPKYLNEPRYLLALESIPFVKKKEQDIGILLALPSYSNYYHWMVELLPRLRMIANQPELAGLPLIMPQGNLPPFIKDSLAIAGVLERTVFLANGVYRFKKLFVPTLLSPPGRPSPLAIEWLRERFLSQGLRRLNERIYITRSDAKDRYIENEIEILPLLRQYGFTRVSLSGCSLQEQIDLFRNARIIVGSHGAGFANLAFASSGATVIELFREDWFHAAFHQIANILDMNYGFLICSRSGAGQLVDVKQLEFLLRQIPDL